MNRVPLAGSIEHYGVLIVGAGPTGLSAATELEARGEFDYLMVEREDRPGGWAKTDRSGAFAVDRAIHVLYFRDPQLRTMVERLLGGGLIHQEKRCTVVSRGISTPFPFHANLYGRDPRVVEECLAGLMEVAAHPASRSSGTFLEWILEAYGPGVAKHFMVPFNTKMWTVPPERMTVDWMRDFIPKVDVARVVEGATSRLDSRVGLNAEFIYPTNGMSALGEALAAELLRPIRYKTSLRAISTQRHLAELSDGRFISYDALISTIPLPTLAGYADRLPDDVRSASARLQGLDLVLVDVGAKQRRDGGVHWSYLPDNDVLPYRIHAGHNLSPELTPQGEAVYCAEISNSRARPLPKGSLKEHVLEDLIQIGLVKSRADVTFLRERRFRNAYALPLAGSASAARHVRNHLARLEVFSVGRYGEWKYSNIEDALVDGPVAVARVLDGREQVASA